ncbi:hypothetical protein KPL71_023776 [Citrus sinensis]|uniref:Uncharacterized protein n=1 Tax=Citrus sinensis TaxID=2711 RepID=A0ACB8ILK1_CITSI|nr:hypothetical protein KPL71_023776 [Citrus sinensis]
MSSINPLLIILVKNELTGENYLDWKRNLFNILTAKGSKYVLTQPCPPEPSLYDYRNQREPYEKWCEANKMAKRYILASISVELHKKHRSMETATEIMASLHQMFGQNTHFAREAALKGITDTKMEEGTKVRDHVLKMMDYLNEVEIHGVQINDKSKINMVIESLPDTFKEFKDSLQGLSRKTRMSKQELGSANYPLKEVASQKASVTNVDRRVTGRKIVLRLLKSEQEEQQQPADQHRIILEQPSLLEPCRSGRVTRLPARYIFLGETYMAISDEHVQNLTSYNEALIDRDVKFWKKAMNQEMESLYSNKVWELVEAPNGVKPIGCKWIYKRKKGVDGRVETFKARLVAEGFTQKEGIDYEETFSTVAMLKSIRILLSIAAVLDYEIWQMDVKTAFLNGHLEENIYMQQPDGFIQKGQEHMTDLLPFRHGITFSKDQSPKTSEEIERMRRVPYADAVGSLVYAMLCTRPDICFAVGMVSRYQFNPGPQYWTAVKHIIKYLKRTKNYMLVYSGDELIPVGYTDSDFISDKDSRKSTSGYVFTLGSGAISWMSVKQSCITDSTTKAEYVATSEAAKEAIWLRKFLRNLEVVPVITAPLKLFM